jgi:Pro-kumamolisin, activation domain/Bacterial Ig-like domain (group 3)
VGRMSLAQFGSLRRTSVLKDNLTLLITYVYSPSRPQVLKIALQVNRTMRTQPARFSRILVFSAFISLLPMRSFAQSSPAAARITQAVDESQLTVLKGNTYPMARAQYDRGPAPASLPMNRMLLVLRRSAEQEAALEQLLDQQQDQSSPNYHQWLTPQQFGQQFGPADQDIQTVTSWLQSHGFQVTRISNGRTVIEFSGTAGQVQEALHTTIHKYATPGANGIEEHWANSSDPQIPAALTSVVVGVDTLHNFPRKPMHVVAGVFKKNKSTGETRPVNPQFSFSCGPSNQPQTCYGVGPYDFATIYNVLPLWNGSPAPVIDGTGQTIGIIGETDVDPKDLAAFRNLFGLPPNPPVVVLDGPDPGVVPGDETESDLDLQWSAAVAKGATIKFVTSATTNTTLGVDLSAQYAVDNNVASVLSESYGICEAALGTAGNQFYNAVWQQAAAEGITAFVSSGDNGSAGCDNHNAAAPAPAEFGLQVSGFASTPYNVAVGGTDFNDLSNPSTYWSTTNTSGTTQLSAKRYIPEVPWNDTCTSAALTFYGFSSNALANCNDPNLLYLNVFTLGGSGGKSSCTAGDGQDITSCAGGYAKPSWQTGTGVPSDGKRDIPDVSLFAATGFYTGSFYIVCEADQTGGTYCDQNPASLDFLGVGGTSASSPAFAGIMGLVDEKTGSRQGNANYVLYQLAAKPGNSCTSSGTPASTCVFYDVTTGTNAMPCDDTVAKSVNCGSAGVEGIGILSGYNSTAGYDLTTGLGSVNAANLVNKWSTVTSALKPSATTLSLSPTSQIAHGSAVTVRINVTPTPPATGTATGNVALMATSTVDPGVSDFALTNGAVNTTTNVLPGGSYSVTAHYPGDGTFAASDSAPVAVTVTPEGSKTAVSFITQDAQGNISPFSSGPYGSAVYLRADVSGNSGDGVPTGTVTFLDGGKSISGIPALTLNSQGNVLPTNPTYTFTAGTHSITAGYSGDPSFNASTSPAGSFAITQAATIANYPFIPSSAVTLGTPVTISEQVTSQSCGNLPTGTITFFVGSTQFGTAQTVQPVTISTCNLSMTSSITTSALPAGPDNVSAKYSGDANYAASVSPAAAVDVQYSTTTSVTSSALTIHAGQSVTFTAKITPVQTGGPAMTGTVAFTANGVYIGSSVPVVNGQAQVTTTSLPGGTPQIYANYSGDSNYSGSNASLTETVTLTSTTTTLMSSSTTIQQGASVTFTAQVTPGQSGGPAMTGTVQFAAGGSNLGTAGVSNGQAQLSTSSLPVGTDMISASYSGDSNYASSQASLSITVTPGPNFSISFSPSVVNVSSPGATANTMLTVTGTNGYNGAITFSAASCIGLPSESSCSFTPTTVTGNGSTSLTVSTMAPSLGVPVRRDLELGGWRRTPGVLRLLSFGLALLALGVQARRRRWNLAGTVLVLALLVVNAACGGGGGGVKNPGTPQVKNQVITVTATSGTTTHTSTFTLNVN